VDQEGKAASFLGTTTLIDENGNSNSDAIFANFGSDHVLSAFKKTGGWSFQANDSALARKILISHPHQSLD
jgi:hypothetical protein